MRFSSTEPIPPRAGATLEILCHVRSISSEAVISGPRPPTIRFLKPGLVKQYAPFIRREVAEFCKKYPRLNREHILFEAVRLALDAENKFGPELGYDFSTLLRHYLKGLHRFAEKEDAFSNIPISAILSDADRAAEQLREEQEAAEAKTPEGDFLPGANGARVTFDFQSMEPNSAEKRKRTVIRAQLASVDPDHVRQVWDAGARYRERLMCAGNQLGKTLAGGMEAGMHATGRYPDWFEGRRFDKPTVGWACSVSGEVARDTVQRILLGRSGSVGTGTIPKDAIIETVTARGIADLVGTIKVRHESGGVSRIGLKSYLAGREAFQGETLDWAWADEEPPSDVFTELLTRLNVGSGPLWLTQTPLLGVLGSRAPVLA